MDSLFLKIFSLIIFLIWVALIIPRTSDYVALKLLSDLPNSCTELPSGYTLVELPDNRGYTVCTPDKSMFVKYYLFINEVEIYPWSMIDRYDVKLDSCEAKEAMHKYLREFNKDKYNDEFIQKQLE